MTASSEILAALNQSYGSAPSKSFVAAVTEGEGGISWDTLFGSGTLLAPTANVQVSSSGRLWTGSLAAFPTWGGAQLANGSITHAAGGAQFEPASYAEALAISGRSGFEPQDQIQATWDYANKIFAQRFTRLTLYGALQAGGNDLLLIPTYLETIWPGGCDSGFPKRFANNLKVVVPLVQPSAAAIDERLAILRMPI